MANTTRRVRGTWIVPLLIFQGLLFFVPLILYLRLAFAKATGPGTYQSNPPTLSSLTTYLTQTAYIHSVIRTVEFGVLVVVVALALAVPLSYVISRSHRFGSALLMVVLISAFSSTITQILGWRVILSNNGPINTALEKLPFIGHPLPLLDSMTSMVIGTAQAVLPFTVVILVPVMDSVPRDLEQAAQSLGASWLRTVSGIVLPIISPGTLSAALVALALAMGSFTTPALLGGTHDLILPTAIYQQTTLTVNYPAASVLALVLIVIVLLITGIALFWNSRRRYGHAA